MSNNKFFHGSSLLIGDNTVPGLQLPDELKKLVPDIFKACRDFGLDYYPTVVQMLTYDEISEVAAYGGFPVRYPHWQWGMEYEELQRGYEHGMHRIYEMVINCLEPDTRILTNKGSKLAKDVSVGDLVIVENSTRNVVAVRKQPLSSTLSIKLKGYLKPLVCTKGHKWMVLTDKGKAWKTAEAIGQGDILLGCDSYYGFTKHPSKMFQNFESHWQSKVVKLPNLMTLELAELTGAIVGDGSCGVKGNENDVYVTVGNDFKDYQKHVANLFETVFNTSVSYQRKEAAVEVMLQSQMAVNYFDINGLTAGSTYKTKRIPHCIWNSSQEFRCAFLRGLFDTDGYASDGLGMSAYNPDLISDVQIILLEMGIKSSAKTIKNGIGVNGDEKFITVLDIKGKNNIEKFKERIGFAINYKQNQLDELLNTEYCRGGGMFVPYLQNSILELGEKLNINSYNNSSLGRSLNSMKKKLVGINCLNSFIERVLVNSSYVIEENIVSLIRTPMLEVELISDGPLIETIDIALDHDAHDFVANGLLSHNTDPCYIYCLDSNTMVDNVTVIAHALGHCDFFKNNIFFSPTSSKGMMNQLANHGTRIRKYIARWGKERVIEFIDHVLRIETLIDFSKAWDKKKIKDPIIQDSRKWKHPKRLNVDETHDYMEPYINPTSWRDSQQEKIERDEAAVELGIFKNPTRDVMGFIRDNAPLKPWQADIMAMLYQKSIYFAPQRLTKMLNEGWASYVDFNMMCKMGLVGLGQKSHDAGIVEYADHKTGVLGGKYSVNPYKVGFCLLMDIEERWNKGRFGSAYEECDNLEQRRNWDENLGLGTQKVFEVRKHYDDVTAILEFFTPEFCDKHEFFDWKRYPNGDIKLEDREFKKIKQNLLAKHVNGGLPEIYLVDPNHKGKGYMLLEHNYQGKTLYLPYVEAVMQSLYFFWNNDIYLTSKDGDGKEIVFACYGSTEGLFEVLTREQYEETKKVKVSG